MGSRHLTHPVLHGTPPLCARATALTAGMRTHLSAVNFLRCSVSEESKISCDPEAKAHSIELIALRSSVMVYNAVLDLNKAMWGVLFMQCHDHCMIISASSPVTLGTIAERRKQASRCCVDQVWTSMGACGASARAAPAAAVAAASPRMARRFPTASCCPCLESASWRTLMMRSSGAALAMSQVRLFSGALQTHHTFLCPQNQVQGMQVPTQV